MGLMRVTGQSRVFVDTSVLYAAVSSPRGYARDLLVAGIGGQCRIFLSNYVIEEARRNFTLKRPALIPFFESFYPLFAHFADPDPEHLHLVASFSALKDSNDIPIIAGALQAHAEYLATYDKRHLLSIKDEIHTTYGLAVVTPQELF